MSCKRSAKSLTSTAIKASWVILSLFYLQSQNAWGEAVFEIRSKRSHRLPIIDFASYVTADTTQEFELGVGDVCFH